MFFTILTNNKFTNCESPSLVFLVPFLLILDSVIIFYFVVDTLDKLRIKKGNFYLTLSGNLGMVTGYVNYKISSVVSTERTS